MPSVFNQQDRRQKRRRRFKLYLLSAIVILIAIGVFYLINFSPLFQIKKFKITGNKQITEKEIIQIIESSVLTNKLYLFLGPKNLFTWNKKSFDFPKTPLEKAAVKRDWFKRTLNITVQERERMAIWCGENNQCYWIDKNGLLFGEAPTTEGSLLLTIHVDNTLIEGNKISEERFIKNIITTLENIPSLNLPIKRAVFDKYLQELRFEAYSGPDIFFSIRFDPMFNLGSLEKLEKKKNLQNMRYIDLRVENRLYYKL